MSDIDQHTKRLFGSLQRSAVPDQVARRKPRGALLDRYKAGQLRGLPLYAQNPHRVASVASIEAQGQRLFSSLHSTPKELVAAPPPTLEPAASSLGYPPKRRPKAKMLPPYALNKLRSARVVDIEAHSKRLFSALSATGNYRYFAVERLKPIAINKSASTVAAYFSRQHEQNSLTGRQLSQMRRVDRKFYEVRNFLYQDHRLDRKDRAQLLSILSFERMKAREAIKQPHVNAEEFSMEASKTIKDLYEEYNAPAFSISGPGLNYEGAAGSISRPNPAQTVTSRVRSIMDRLAKKVSPEGVANRTRELEEHDLYARKAKLSSNVHYVDRKTDKVVFVDTGKHIALRRTGLTESGVALALKMAKDRFGSTLTINGSAEFKKLVVEAAAKHNMDVHFTDKKMNQALEDRKTELALARESEKIEPAPLATPDTAAPEAATPAPAAPAAAAPDAVAAPPAPSEPTVLALKSDGTNVDLSSLDAINAAIKEIDKKLQEYRAARQGAFSLRSGIREELKGELPPITRAELNLKADDYAYSINSLDSQIKVLSGDREQLVTHATALEGKAQAAPEAPQPGAKAGSIIQGTLLDHGAAPYMHDANKDVSYYVSIKTLEGVKTLWGVGLKEAMAERNLKQGDPVTLTDHGKQPVTVPRREANGSVTDVETFRRTWTVSSLSDPQREGPSFLAAELAKALDRTGLTRSEFLEQPGESVKLAKFHAANIVTGSDASTEGKQLVSELMGNEAYREAFSAEVEVYYDNLPATHKAQAQEHMAAARDLVSAATLAVSQAAPAVSTQELDVSGLAADMARHGAKLEQRDAMQAENMQRFVGGEARATTAPEPLQFVHNGQPAELGLSQHSTAAPGAEQLTAERDSTQGLDVSGLAADMAHHGAKLEQRDAMQAENMQRFVGGEARATTAPEPLQFVHNGQPAELGLSQHSAAVPGAEQLMAERDSTQGLDMSGMADSPTFERDTPPIDISYEEDIEQREYD